MSWHVYPVDDSINHEVSEDCVCGPDADFDEGVYVIIHHPLTQADQ